MGAAITNNYAEASVKSLTSVIYNNSQNCLYSSDQRAELNIGKIINSNVLIESNTTQRSLADLGCIQTSSTSADVKQKVDQQAQQIANSVVDFFSVGASVANNTAKLYTDLANEVINNLEQTCVTKISQSNTIAIGEVIDSNVKIAMDWEQTAKALTDCVSNNTSVTNIKNEISQAIKQEATAKVLGLGSLMYGIIIIIVGAVALLVFGIILVKSLGSRRKTNTSPPDTTLTNTLEQETVETPNDNLLTQ
jgi:hypothetical protein